MMSLPPKERMRSFCEVPGRKSGPFVPLMFAAQATAETPNRHTAASAVTTRSCFTMTPSCGAGTVLPSSVRAPRAEADIRRSRRRPKADGVADTGAQTRPARDGDRRAADLAGPGPARVDGPPAARRPPLDDQRPVRRRQRPDHDAAVGAPASHEREAERPACRLRPAVAKQDARLR